MTNAIDHLTTAQGWLARASRTNDRRFARYAMIDAQSARARATSAAQRAQAASIIRTAEEILS